MTVPTVVRSRRQAESLLAQRVANDHRFFVGIEHEYQVLDSAEQRVAFGPLIARAGDRVGRRLDPADAAARRTAWGGVVTADGDEAESATPMIPLAPNWTAAMLDACDAGAADLADLAVLAAPYSLRGYSTHISVSALGLRLGHLDEVARLVLDSAAVAVALLLDNEHSPGLLVRPRPDRVELCGDFLGGDRLAVAATFAAGAVLAAQDAAAARRLIRYRLTLRTEPTRQRYGWFLPRHGVGADLYRLGRATPVTRSNGETVTAGVHLQEVWSAIRDVVTPFVTDTELMSVDRMVDGRSALPCESKPSMLPTTKSRVPPTLDAIITRHHDALSVECVAATWTAAVFALDTPEGTSLLTIPGRSVTTFLQQLDAHAIDTELRRLATSRTRIRASVRTDAPHSQSKVRPEGLIPIERDHTGRTPPRPPSRRRDKNRTDHESSYRPRRLRSGRRLLMIGIAVLAIVGMSTAVIAGRSRDKAKTTAVAITELGVDPSATSSVATFVNPFTTSAATPPASFSGTATFTAFSSGLDFDSSVLGMFGPIERARGLYPAPVGASEPVTGYVIGACDGVVACSVVVNAQGVSAAALSPYISLLPNGPLVPVGNGSYRYTATAPWSAIAAQQGTDACQLGDPIHSLVLDVTITGRQLIGTLTAGLEPQFIARTARPGRAGEMTSPSRSMPRSTDPTTTGQQFRPPRIGEKSHGRKGQPHRDTSSSAEPARHGHRRGG